MRFGVGSRRPVQFLEVRAIRDFVRHGSSSLMWRSIEHGALPLPALPSDASLRFDIDFSSDEMSTVNLIGEIVGPAGSGLHVTQALELRVSAGDSGTATLSFDPITFPRSGIYTLRLSDSRSCVWEESLRVGIAE